ncbi:MAG TPA: PAS domain S-box protein [Edaphobacter sp.]|nr:PAS domain S-box protein [Edaphobacter sp.]
MFSASTHPERNMRVAVAAAFVVILFVCVMTGRFISSLLKDARWVEHTEVVLDNIHSLEGLILRKEVTRQRYQLNHDVVPSESRNELSQEIERSLGELRDLTSDNPRQQENVRAIEASLEQDENTTHMPRQSHKDGFVSPGSVSVQSEALAPPTLLVGLGAMRDEERTLLAERRQAQQAGARDTYLVLAILSLMLVALLTAIYLIGQREIKHRRKLLEERKGEEDRYRGLLEAAPDAMVVVNQAGEVVLLNLQAEKQFGYRRDELVGQKVTSIIPVGFAERLIADGTRTAAEALAQHIGTGIELSGKRKDGTPFPIEIMLSPLENSEGTLVTAAIRDISERKLAEDALRTSEERLRLIVSNARDYAIVMLDPDGRVVSWNDGAERIKGYKTEEILGQHFSRFYPVEDVSNGKPEFELAEATRTGRCEDDGWRIRKDGSRFFANEVTTALYDERGRLRGFGRITRDITERKKSEAHLAETMAELRRSNDELQQFSNVASHDLQEPLRMVASFTQLLSRRYKGRLDADADEYIAYAVEGCNRMKTLIEDLLIYSNVGTGERSTEQSSCESALSQALANLQMAIEESGTVVTQDPLPAVAMDGARLSQLFQNLVGNAIKYRGAEAPRIHVSAERRDGDGWTFSVRDNGLGIDRQYFQKIFILFQRLHGRNEFKGTGIGLSICKKIVERSGGRIWVESQPKQGSIFYFSLPEGNVA